MSTQNLLKQLKPLPLFYNYWSNFLNRIVFIMFIFQIQVSINVKTSNNIKLEYNKLYKMNIIVIYIL